MRAWTTAFALASAALACAACGAQIVSFDIDLGDGGAATNVTPLDATSGTGAIADATATDSSSPFSGFDSAGSPFGRHDAAVACVATCALEMGACTLSSDCCGGNRCVASVCTPATADCLAAGALCQNFGCCSGRCEPSSQGGNGPASTVCTQYCDPDTEPCTKASDCCSLACNDGTCGGAICSSAGSVCQSNSDCCSDTCTAGHCFVSPAMSCLASGEFCGDSGAICCSGPCNMDTGRCSSAAYGPCLPKNSPCSRDNSAPQCCGDNTNSPAASSCTYSATAHVPTCSGCMPDGQRCAQESDCCSKICNASGTCGNPVCLTQQQP